MVRATDESVGYIGRNGFDSEMDFGPMIMVLKGLHVSMNACFIILSYESPLNGIHDSFASQYPWLFCSFSSSYTWWALWLIFAYIIPGKDKAKEDGESSGSGALG